MPDMEIIYAVFFGSVIREGVGKISKLRAAYIFYGVAGQRTGIYSALANGP
jgi:hypothetical protein